MKNCKPAFYALALGASLVISLVGSARADEISITTKPAPGIGGKWVLGARESNGQTPLEVEVKKGDVITIKLPTAALVHGFVTIDKKPWKGVDQVDDARDKKELVVACGQAELDSAVLQQVDCDSQPAKFGETSKGTLRLQVLENFTGDVFFWCTAHFQMMWGVLKLQPQTP